MRFSLFLLALVTLVAATPSQEVFGDPDDVCPDLKVRCVKDSKWPSGIVGDIGKRPFCRDGVRCNQCDKTANDAACNLKYPKKCAAKCEAYGPIPV